MLEQAEADDVPDSPERGRPRQRHTRPLPLLHLPLHTDIRQHRCSDVLSTMQVMARAHTSLAAIISSVSEPDCTVSMSADHTAEGCRSCRCNPIGK